MLSLDTPLPNLYSGVGAILAKTQPPAAAATAAAADVTVDEPIVIDPRLPEWQRGLGLVHYREKYPTRGSAPTTIAGRPLNGCALLWDQNPWIDPVRGRVLFLFDSGEALLFDDVCEGVANFEGKWWNLDGTESSRPAEPPFFPPDPQQPPSGFGPGGGLPDLPNPGGGGGLHIYGLNPGDIAKFLSGIGGTSDLGGVVAAIAALVGSAYGINTTVGGLPEQLGGAFASPFSLLGGALDRIAPGLGTSLQDSLGAHAEAGADAATAPAAGNWGTFPAAAHPVVSALVGALGDVLAQFGDLYKGGVDALLRAMLDVFRTSIEDFGTITPANVDKVAAAALRDALTAGTTAQLAGMGLELLHPLKSMGVQQAIGVLAEFAGFSEIAKPFFGATLRHAIGKPAEHRAALHFRTTLPNPELVRELAAIGLVPIAKYHERLELEGYPEPYPAALADIVYTPPQARFLGQLLDGSESDQPWLARKFRRLGFSPEDTDRAVRAAELKTTAPGRSHLVATLLAEYRQGHVTDDELHAGLQGAGLSATHQKYYARVAALERRGSRMEGIATEVDNQYRNDVVSRAAAGQLLTALGYTPDEVNVRLTVGDLKRNLVQVTTEARDIEGEIRALKAKGLASATKQLRAGFLDLGHFLAVGVGMGYDRAYLENVADITMLQGPPSSTAGSPAIGLGALQETQDTIAKLLAREVGLKRADRVAALASMQALGLPSDLATTLLDLAEAIAGPSPFAGDFGFPTGTAPGGPVGQVVEVILGGLGKVRNPLDLFNQLLTALHLPARDAATVAALIRDLRSLFRK